MKKNLNTKKKKKLACCDHSRNLYLKALLKFDNLKSAVVPFSIQQNLKF